MDDTTRYRHWLERHLHGGMDRRTFLAGLGAVGLAYGLAGGPMRQLAKAAYAQGPNRIRYDGFGGTVDKAVGEFALDPFTQKTGVRVDRGSYGSMDEFLTKVKASSPGEYNVFLCTDQFNYKRFTDLGYAVELDEAKIPNLENCMPVTVDLYRKLTNGKLSAVPYVYSVSCYAYNTQKVDGEYAGKAGIDLLIDPKFKGKIAGDFNWANRIWI